MWSCEEAHTNGVARAEINKLLGLLLQSKITKTITRARTLTCSIIVAISTSPIYLSKSACLLFQTGPRHERKTLDRIKLIKETTALGQELKETMMTVTEKKGRIETNKEKSRLTDPSPLAFLTQIFGKVQQVIEFFFFGFCGHILGLWRERYRLQVVRRITN